MNNAVEPFHHRVPLYPFFIAVSPVFSLFALNGWGLNTVDIIRPTLVYLAFAFFCFAICLKILGRYRSAAVLSCTPIFSVILFNHASSWSYSVLGSNISVSFFLSVWVVLTLGLCFFLARALKQSTSSFLKLTAILNTFGITLVFLSLLPLILSGFLTDAGQSKLKTQDQLTESFQHEWLPVDFSMEQVKVLPDVYFIIMDSYARGDILESRFGLDNSQFLEWLESEDFFVAPSSHSNYAWTHLSLSSTMNAEYVQSLIPRKLTEGLPEQFRDRHLFIKKVLTSQFISDNRVYRFFSSLGYRVISSGLGDREFWKQYRSFSEALLGPLSEIEETLLINSILRPIFSSTHNNDLVKKLKVMKYDQVVGALDALVFDAHERSPKFVFYHIMSPHEPFSFNSNGSPVTRHPYYDSADWMTKNSMPGYREWFRKNYPDNVEGLNHHLKAAIQDIMDLSQGKAIIIIQSDHGSALGLNLQSPEQSDLKDRFGILNAIYIPRGFPRQDLTNSMSAVNTFPVVLNNIFNLQLPLQENRAYYSKGDLDFVDVTNQVQE